MKRQLASTLVLFSLACYSSQQSSCDLGGERPSPIPVVVNVASPSPSPSASTSPTPESCRIDYMILRPQEGVVLGLNETTILDLTPYQNVTNPDGSVAQREVSRACNDPRIPLVQWRTSSASILFLSGGFNPEIRRFGVGFATITAKLENTESNAITVRTP